MSPWSSQRSLQLGNHLFLNNSVFTPPPRHSRGSQQGGCWHSEHSCLPSLKIHRGPKDTQAEGSELQLAPYEGLGFPGGTSGKESTCRGSRHKRCGFDPWVGKMPWRRKWQPTPVFLPGKFHGHKGLAGYSPWSYKESNMTERVNAYHIAMRSHCHSLIEMGRLRL